MKKTVQKTVVITGGSQGIGAAIAHAFYASGMFVVIGSRKKHGSGKESGDRFSSVMMDVRFEEDHQRLVQAALNKTGRLDVYINCAGFSKWSPVGKITEKFWDEMISVNLKGTFWGCKTAARHLGQGGAIINISSLAGRRGSVNNAVYCASKFGVTGLTQALAKELGPAGIRVNAVCPVYVNTTGMIEALNAKDSPAGGRNAVSYLKQFTQEQSALKRLPTAQEVSQVCLFLASDAASAVTGQSIHVDCGVLPQ